MVPRTQPPQPAAGANSVTPSFSKPLSIPAWPLDRQTNAEPDSPVSDTASGTDMAQNEQGFIKTYDGTEEDLALRPRPSPPRPSSVRATTDPSPTTLLQDYFAGANAPRQHGSKRNKSPYSRSHLRSRSSGSALAAPVMTRAHSLPTVHMVPRATEMSYPSATTSSSASLSPSPVPSGSPLRSPARVRSPFRPTLEDRPRSPSWYDVSGSAIESIQEDSELDLNHSQPTPPAANLSFSRSGSLRRRPASPLHSLVQAPHQTHQSVTSFPSTAAEVNANFAIVTPGSGSPSLQPQTFNESYPSLSLHHYASTSSFSSLSSTPSSARSRSPSISSLETIEDAPDLESAAVESERMQRLKLAAERADRLERGESVDDLDESGRRRSLDAPRGFGFGRSGGAGRERKRWSICGGERRGDLDLETIWED